MPVDFNANDPATDPAIVERATHLSDELQNSPQREASASGIPALRFWNAGMAFVSYALFAGILAELRTLVGELDRRV